MRRALLLAVLGAVLVAGVAVAATSPNYILSVKVTPKRSGTVAKPTTIGTTFAFKVSTVPAGRRPPVVRGFHITYEGVRENTRDFKGCSTSTLTNPQKGPSACPKGSKLGSGFFMAAVGPSADTTTISLTCRVELSIYNGGNHNLILYVYAPTGKAGECPLPSTFAIVDRLTEHKNTLVQNFSTPAALRHPATGEDVSVLSSSLTIAPTKARVAMKVGGKKVMRTVGLFESIACPINHQRQVEATFTEENGSGRLRTANVPCR